MNRHTYLTRALCVMVTIGLTATGGCRGHQFGHLVRKSAPDMVGSHAAGAATFNPLIDDAVAQLLGRQMSEFQQVSHVPGEISHLPGEISQLPGEMPPPRRICFVGVENKSAEEIGDFKEQIYQQIDTQITQSGMFAPISKRFVDAGLQESRLRPDSLFIPGNMQQFTAVMEQMQQPFDYLLYATITSGTTESNASYQRDYVLTMEMVDTHTGHYDKQSAEVSKGYHRSRVAALKHYNPFKRSQQ